MSLSLEDRDQIRELYARYAHAIDYGTPQDYADCFTEDGAIRGSSGTESRGHAILRDVAVNSQIRLGKARHWTSNLTIEPAAEDDGARGSCYLAIMSFDPPGILYMCRYTDDVVRTPKGWRFAYRFVQLDGGGVR